MENKELIETIRGMLKEELKPIREEVSKVKGRLIVLKIKEQATHKKLDNLTLDVEMTERSTRKDIAQANDAIETLIAVLEAEDILPRAPWQQNPRLYAGDVRKEHI